ncbi:MAG: tetratricopeptide repeat protein [Pirellulales bacterium]
MNRARWAIATASLLVATGVGYFWLRSNQPTADSLSAPTAASEALAAAKRRSFHPREAGYVGSAVCAECHGEIARRYQGTHSMARSMAPIGQETPIEDFTKARFQPPGFREYEVERTGDGTFHHERWKDVDGETIYDQKVKIDFAMGSGRRGRSFVLSRDGFLFQSSLSWYSQEQRWDLAPGYPPRIHDRFDRKLLLQCVYCHAGLIDVEDMSNDRFGQPPFVEAAIGCERCHGPGADHVAKQTKSPAAGPDDSICNPSRLGPAEREAVCYQCHLRREPSFTQAGKSPFDYRPGQAYDEVWLTYVPSDPRPEELATLVEQHRASECFRQSAGRFGCTSCHDPHERPAPAARDAFYRERCNQCHADRGCSFPAESRAEAQDSCIRCHMPSSPTRGIPHTALTDHRMLRTPQMAPAPNAEAPIEPSRLTPFTYGAPRLAPESARRAEGLMRANLGAMQGLPAETIQAERLLNPQRLTTDQLVAHYREDFAVLYHLGLVFVMQNRPGDALAAWRAALELEPTQEQLRQQLATMLLRGGDVERGLPLVRALVKDHPYAAEFHWLLVDALSKQGDMNEAVRQAEATLERDPTATQVRLWLARAYAELGQKEKSLEQQQTLNRMQGLRVTPTPER